MASAIDIANLALAHLGDDANVASFDPPEGGPQAEHCARFYPIARDRLLEMHAWSFAVRTDALTPLGAVDGDTRRRFALPADCLRPLGLRAFRDFTSDFAIETAADGQPTLIADGDGAVLRYVRRIEDATRFSPLFVEALSWLLASMVAGPLIKGESGVAAAKSCWQVFLMRFADAAEADANKGSTKIDPVAPWIGSRGFAPRDAYLGGGLWHYGPAGA